MGAVEAYSAGFTALVSVMPPDAQVSADSKLSVDDAGKAPALKGNDGRYFGYNWMSSRPVLENVKTWVDQGSSVGFLASHYPAIDIDIMNEGISDAVVAAVTERMGPCLMRTGQAPKRLLVFRSDEPLRSFDMHYSRWSDLLGADDKHLIQFLGKGRQYVMFGMHPRTRVPYYFDDPGMALPLGPAALPTLTPDNVAELFDIINAVLASFGFTTSSDARARLIGAEVDQDELKAPNLADLAELVGRMPNVVPDREEYVSLGYAIKAASQDDPEAGFSLFMDWCERWEDGANDPEVVRRDWDKMVPPYRMGYEWLMSRAKMWGANVSDLQFGQAQPMPVAGKPQEEDADAELAAIQTALAGGSEDAMFSDRWLARKFLQTAGKSYMVPRGVANDSCFKWDGKHWVEVGRGALTHQVGAFLAAHTSMAKQAYENPREGAAAAMRLGAAKTIGAVMSLVVADTSMTPNMAALDSDPDLLDTPAGPIHLPTGKVIPADPAYLLTKSTTVAMDPSAHCPRWMRFIDEASMGDPELAFWLQCLGGYALTGHTREQLFPFFTGNGNNGKSVFVRVLSAILGPNAVSVPVELFQATRGANSDVPYQLARLHGARLVTTSETKAGGIWDEQRVKQVTGEDEITARVPYGKPFSFSASCTLVVVGNHTPDMEAVTDAMVRRMRMVPWRFKPAVVDKLLFNKLSAELPGILAWLVQGAVAWYAHGLPRCEAIQKHTSEYVAEQDPIGMWIQDQVEYPGRAFQMVGSRDLYDNFVTWCRVNSVQPCPMRMFHVRVAGPLREMGAVKTRSGATRGWRNIQVTPVQDAPTNVVNFPAVAPPSPPG